MGDEQTYKLFSRLKQSEDGVELIEFLNFMSKKNYEEFKISESNVNDLLKGKALAIDYLIKLFDTCDDKLISLNKKDSIENIF